MDISVVQRRRIGRKSSCDAKISNGAGSAKCVRESCKAPHEERERAGCIGEQHV